MERKKSERNSFGRTTRSPRDDDHVPVVAISFDDGDETFGEKNAPRMRLGLQKSGEKRSGEKR